MDTSIAAIAARIDNELSLTIADDDQFTRDLRALVVAVRRMREALQTTAGNIRSLGPAGGLDRVPMEYQRWLASVEAALVI